MKREKDHTVLVVYEAGGQSKDDVVAKRERIWVGRGEGVKYGDSVVDDEGGVTCDN